MSFGPISNPLWKSKVVVLFLLPGISEVIASSSSNDEVSKSPDDEYSTSSSDRSVTCMHYFELESSIRFYIFARICFGKSVTDLSRLREPESIIIRAFT